MCTVAISNSPVYSPSSKLSSCSSSPSSSFKFRLQKPPSGLIRASNEEGPTSCSPKLLKRKRPTRLDIPVASSSFCADRSTPVMAEDRWKEVVVEGDGYSVFCKRGKREAMEDRFVANVDFEGQNKKGFFGVFDGHGGSKAAEFASKNLEKSIENEVEKMGEFEIVEAIRQGYLNTDSEFLKQEQRGGASCVTAIINSGNLVASNAGDCRAVVSIGGAAEALTSDHRPSRLDEKQRIESLGGYVDCSRGTSRVLGSLAVSRGIGDRSMKQWITAEPETKIFKITPEFEFLIMASDGLWDKVSNQEAVDLARPFCASSDKLEAVSACKKLVELSASRGSVDDTSVMIVQLGRFC